VPLTYVATSLAVPVTYVATSLAVPVTYVATSLAVPVTYSTPRDYVEPFIEKGQRAVIVINDLDNNRD
jgi:hypothetical protein